MTGGFILQPEQVDFMIELPSQLLQSPHPTGELLGYLVILLSYPFCFTNGYPGLLNTWICSSGLTVILPIAQEIMLMESAIAFMDN